MEYSTGKIYGIKNIINDKLYIGSTKNTLDKRWQSHKTASCKKTAKLYAAIVELGIENFSIYLIEDYPCKSRKELLDRESFYIRQYDSISNGYNMYLSGRTKAERKEQKRQNDKAYREAKGQELLDRKKQYYQANREHIIEMSRENQQRNKEHRKEYMRQYQQKHKERLAQQHKDYYQKHKDKWNKNM